MIEIATIVCLSLAGVTVIVNGVRSLRTRPVSGLEISAAALLEVGVLFYVGVRVAELAGGHHPPSLGLAIGYLIGIVLVMPVAALLGIAEDGRWGPVVIVVGAIVVCVLFARIDQVWSAHG